MGLVLVQAAELQDGRITRLQVKFPNLPKRIIDRDTAVAWMRDGHSFVPVFGELRGPALQLVEADGELYVRDDHEPVAADALPALPPVP